MYEKSNGCNSVPRFIFLVCCLRVCLWFVCLTPCASVAVQVTVPAMPGADLTISICAAGEAIAPARVQCRIAAVATMLRAAPVEAAAHVARGDLGDVSDFAVAASGLIAVVHHTTNEVALLSADAKIEHWRTKVCVCVCVCVCPSLSRSLPFPSSCPAGAWSGRRQCTRVHRRW